MDKNFQQLPNDLPKPVDDGKAKHLTGLTIPSMTLRSTAGDWVNLGKIPGKFVLYVYPMTGKPGVALPDGWDAIPGARGCTPQACEFRDHYHELARYQTDVFGVSAQTTEYQAEVKNRLHLPFELLSDSDFVLKHALQLPTFEAAGMELYKRLTLIVDKGVIIKVFYPVFPPDKSAEMVLRWLANPTCL